MPDKILDKPSSLSESEYDIMKSHVLKGYMLLKDIEDMDEIAEIVLNHHEKFDGTGYPNHVKGNDIPLLSRIITVADSYDVITSNRPYKRILDMDYAIDELISCKGTHFDDSIVDVFVTCLKSGKVHKFEND
jgi:HD-GYP domain-containing protein (c-di-GMP phosphodiesterase class II)